MKRPLAGSCPAASAPLLPLAHAPQRAAMCSIAVIWLGDFSDSSAACAAGRGRTSNSRSRTHCSRSGVQVAAPPATGIKCTADVAGVQRAKPAPGSQATAAATDRRRGRSNVCWPSARPVADGPEETYAVRIPAPQSCRPDPPHVTRGRPDHAVPAPNCHASKMNSTPSSSAASLPTVS